MRKKKPIIASIEEVTITRQGDSVQILYADSSICTTVLKIGQKINHMIDQDILELHNETIRFQEQLASEYNITK